MSTHSFSTRTLAVLCACLISSSSLLAQQSPHPHDEPHSPDARESAARHEQSALPAGVSNAWCPVLPDEVVDPEVHADFDGQEIFFCCRKCLRKFQQDPSAYAAQLPPAMAAAFLMPTEQVHGHDDEHDEQGAAAGEPGGHDHSSHGAGGGAHGLGAWIGWIGRFHPMVVHFPIALLLLAALSRLLAVRLSSTAFASASRVCLWAGAAGAAVAALLGWADASGVAESYTGFPARLLLFHRWGGTLTAVVAALTLLAAERARRAEDGSWHRSHHLGLALCALLVGLTGHLGASLIFGWDYLSLP